MTKQTVKGTRILPNRIDVKVDGNWVNGIDLATLPPGTKYTDIREVFSYNKGRVYQSITDFVDGSQVISRVDIPTADVVEDNKVRTVGLVDSPTSFLFYDTSPF